jgi:hypothetical protein
MMYVGSTMVPSLRFHNHLVLGDNLNQFLQEAIKQHGLSQFTVYILETVKMPDHLTYTERVSKLRGIEQSYMDQYPKSKLFNTIKSKAL